MAVFLAGCAGIEKRPGPLPPVGRFPVADSSAPAATRRVLFLYDATTGLHIYDFATKRFSQYGSLWPDDPNQDVRALEFAVKPGCRSIYAADHQRRGYPFYSLDLATRDLKKLGSPKDCAYSSIAFHPKNRRLYGTIWFGPYQDFLALIDPADGTYQKIAEIVTGARLAFAPDGTLYAVISGGYLDRGVVNGQLYRIHPETAEHILIGSPELDYKSSNFTIARDGTGYLLEHQGKLRSLDLKSGESKLLGDSGCRDAFGLFEYDIPEDFLPDPESGG